MEYADIPIDAIRIGERGRKDEGDIPSLVASIKVKGLIQPITVDKSLKLLAGERRLKACKQLGHTTIPAIIRDTSAADVAKEIDEKEIELFENLHRKDMTWQEKVDLQDEIHELYLKKHPGNWSQQDTAKTLNVARSGVTQGIALAKAMKKIPRLRECATEDEAVKTFKRLVRDGAILELAARQKAGQVGFHRWAMDSYIVGDAIAGLKKRSMCNIGFMEVDPPFGVNLNELKEGSTIKEKGYTEIDAIEYPGFIEELAKEVYRVMDDNGYCVWWFGPDWFWMVRNTLREAGFEVQAIPGIWVRGTQGQSKSPTINLASGYESFFIARKGSPTLLKPGRLNVFNYTPVPPNEKIHPTEKPRALYEEFLATFVRPGAIVCSVFAGSGAMLRATYKYGCPALGWDLSEDAKSRFLVKVSQEFGEIPAKPSAAPAEATEIEEIELPEDYFEQGYEPEVEDV